MNKFLLTSVLIVSIIPEITFAQSVQTDTIKVIPIAQNITVTRNGNKTIVNANIPKDDNSGTFDKYTYKVTVDNGTESLKSINDDMNNDLMLKLPFLKPVKTEKIKKGRSRYYVIGLKYIYWGWNFNYASKNGIKNSFEAGITDIIGIDWRTSKKTTIGIGIGCGMTRVSAADNMLFIKKRSDLVNPYRNSNILGLTPSEDNMNVDFARWDTWHIHVPVMLTQKLAGKFGFSIATILNFNTGSTAVNRYTIDNIRYTEKIKGLNQRLVTADIMATVGICGGFGFYSKWSPITSMEHQNGPSFRSFSIGVNLNF